MLNAQTFTALLWVGAGGALGSCTRYLSFVVLGQYLGTGFPWGTLFVNIVGSFVMGVLAELGALVWQPSQDVKLLLMTGVLGGFTTFSTFSLDVALLVERHDWTIAGLYVAASVLLSVGALFAAMALVRNLV
ncbi:fluoride efflux transporter CrcB [Magnetospirillum sp. 64-120]|uniref:fluoride efflux transporter CrcB n=1 Tax=Magnetospirillum sp. 64-120 TaxID=1895778 RepID=UPI00092C643C|nr:fluoride efflux transporter CrcB [Magnetospirillum sp. 64-120]OJX81861.1 MAG: protein CrcB [Magnetospirillum sp. 64-120]